MPKFNLRTYFKVKFNEFNPFNTGVDFNAWDLDGTPCYQHGTFAGAELNDLMYGLEELANLKKDIDESNNLDKLSAWRQKFVEAVKKVYQPDSETDEYYRFQREKNADTPLWINPHVDTWRLTDTSSIPEVLAHQFQIDRVQHKQLKKMLQEIKTWQDWYEKKYQEVAYGGGY